MTFSIFTNFLFSFDRLGKILLNSSYAIKVRKVKLLQLVLVFQRMTVKQV